MSPRTFYLAICSSLLAASGCAFEATGPSDDGVGTQSNTLSATGGGTIPQVDPLGEEMGPIKGNSNPIAPDPAKQQQASGDPGKPSPDPWWTESVPLSGSDPILPGHVDPLATPRVK